MPPANSTEFHVPVIYNKLDNGLKVVLSPDHTAPTTAVAVYYNIGFRIEPKDRTGFAHLFEHLMFQGSQNLGKMEFIKLIQSNGGILNGSTRFDFTNYFEIVPSHTLQTMLWAEADRMRGLAITQENLSNQQEVVKNEVRVNVLNAPYGGFPWLDLPQYANSNWYNAHNFYGDLKDLDAATLADAQKFFKTYYAPNNAALVVTGDFNPDQAMAWIRQYFSGIPAVSQPASVDLTEPRQVEEKHASKDDAKATRPALAVAYHTPAPDTAEYYALGLLEQILAQGNDSMLYQSLVQQKGLTGGVSSSMNPLGNMFNVDGPSLLEIWLFHDNDKSADQIIAAMDEQIEKIRTRGIDAATLERAQTKMRSDLYDQVEGLFGFGKADLLASFALFDDNPGKINEIIPRFQQITPELIQKTAQEYLRPTNRTILTIVPKGAGK
ncbi:MAG: pitrilysin family protein [Acidobacteriota bacterium]